MQPTQHSARQDFCRGLISDCSDKAPRYSHSRILGSRCHEVAHSKKVLKSCGVRTDDAEFPYFLGSEPAIQQVTCRIARTDGPSAVESGKGAVHQERPDVTTSSVDQHQLKQLVQSLQKLIVRTTILSQLFDDARKAQINQVRE